MKSANVLVSELRHIRFQLLPILTRPADDYEKTDAQLERILTQLKAILRDAQQQESFARMQKWNAAPGTTQRWSLEQKERESRNVIDEALALQKEVEKLLGPNWMEVGHNAIDNIEDWHHLQHQLHSFGHNTGMQVPSYQPAHPGSESFAGDPLVAAVSWVIVALESWKLYKRRNAKGTGIGNV